MEWSAVDFVALLGHRISNARVSRDAKIVARDEHLRLAAVLDEEIRTADAKLAAWAELEEDYRCAAEQAGELHLLEPTGSNGVAAPQVPFEQRGHVPMPEPPKKRIRGTQEKVVAFYQSLGGESFTIDDAVRAIHADNPEVPRDSIGSILSTLKGRGILKKIKFGQYQEVVRAQQSVASVSAPGFDLDPADDYLSDVYFGKDDAEEGGGSDD